MSAFGMAIVIAHAPWYLAVPMLISLGDILAFLWVAATQETEYLTRILGGKFLEYKSKYMPFYHCVSIDQGSRSLQQPRRTKTGMTGPQSNNAFGRGRRVFTASGTSQSETKQICKSNTFSM
jgi:hypothetical protein